MYTFFWNNKITNVHKTTEKMVFQKVWKIDGIHIAAAVLILMASEFSNNDALSLSLGSSSCAITNF